MAQKKDQLSKNEQSALSCILTDEVTTSLLKQRVSTFFMESLILAQDERWRRA